MVELPEEAIPLHYDPDDPASIRLRLTGGRPVLDWPIALPETDPRGVLSADSFECWKKASDSRKGIAGYHYSFKGRGKVACHSWLEARLLRWFEMLPFVVEIRTQYPQWNRAEFLGYCRAGCRYPENKLRTIDFMLRLCRPGLPYHVYHGVSVKPEAKRLDPLVVSRHEKEAAGLWEWGGTHEVITEQTVPEQETTNYERLLSYMGKASTEEIGRLAAPAAAFGKALNKSKAKGPMDRVVGMVGKRHRWDLKESYRVLGVAFFLGHLRWDHRYPVHPLEDMFLLK
ncbi:hypothetical protein P9239_19340 [Caballeronia sp. LZ062]|uniref:hypothetical protein n=1 Tax=unclassified Caballeronia TaxID=2646786 RepID=UPI002859794D|nr:MULTISPECIES: hypothetical protein [unclassified Caballeronia]MDR5855705.1 hypothetical protein [Caballeronia sp. LZ050]MDR5872507.1 hypothetical protein [Caballeronia sp. LZ062]